MWQNSSKSKPNNNITKLDLNINSKSMNIYVQNIFKLPSNIQKAFTTQTQLYIHPNLTPQTRQICLVFSDASFGWLKIDKEWTLGVAFNYKSIKNIQEEIHTCNVFNIIDIFKNLTNR